ncbi:MAG TPA: HAD hydrolase family protein [Melioribacteraceae bacterium]|nr:HAD hydrolase family protein [Melioribacteraceae bacterium]
MVNLNTNFIERLKKIKMVITDVDGVLTDGGLYYTADGLVMKKFNVKDGMGSVLLRENGIICGIISTDVSPVITKRGERLKLDFTYIGIHDKKSKMLELCDEYDILPEEVAFIGDDVNDVGIISAVGFSAAPADAVDKIIDMVDYICVREGGKGAFRELSDLLIKHKYEED